VFRHQYPEREPLRLVFRHQYPKREPLKYLGGECFPSNIFYVLKINIMSAYDEQNTYKEVWFRADKNLRSPDKNCY